MTPMEQRRSPRHQIEAPAIMRLDGRSGPLLVTLLDVSATGLRVSAPSALPSGAKVTIKCNGVEVKGEIRYSREIDGPKYHIGVLVDTATEEGELDLVALLGPALVPPAQRLQRRSA